MKKIIVVVCLLAIVFLPGCTIKNTTEESENPKGNSGGVLNIVNPALRVGDIYLGMPIAELDKVLTDNYTEENVIEAEAGYFGREYFDRRYQSGVDLQVSKAEGILQFTVYNQKFATDLGVKVGDDAGQAIEKYREKYQEWVGNQSPEKLIGWFEVQPGILLILDYEKDNDQFNPPVTEGAKIKSIAMGYTKYFD